MTRVFEGFEHQHQLLWSHFVGLLELVASVVLPPRCATGVCGPKPVSSTQKRISAAARGFLSLVLPVRDPFAQQCRSKLDAARWRCFASAPEQSQSWKRPFSDHVN